MAKAIAATARTYEGAGLRAETTDFDVGLMLAFQRGDESAFRGLVERNHARVIGLVYRFVGSMSEAEDLAQEVFLRVYRARQTYRPTAKFSTWLFRITANVSLNALRAHSSRRDDVSIDRLAEWSEKPQTPADTDGKTPEHRLQRTELQDKVQEAIRALPEKQQIAVVLNKYEGMGYAAIAKTLGCSTMAVKSLLARARENLKDHLLLYIRTGRDRLRIS